MADEYQSSAEHDGDDELKLARPGSHSCGNKKGKREKFPKRKEEKRGKRISLDLLCSTVTLSYDKKIQKIPRK